MWKTIVLCASLYGSAALGLVTAGHWVEPAALPLAAAIGLCLVGVILILISPSGRSELPETLRNTEARLDALDEGKPITTLVTASTGTHPHLR